MDTKQADVLADQLTATAAQRPTLATEWVSSGCTTLNMALTGKPRYGYHAGGYYLVVGGSSSGKTMLMLTMLAEVANNPNFDHYQIKYDNVEDGAQMDFVKFFGQKMAARIEAPRIVDGVGMHSETIDDFYFNFDDAMDAGPCIYLLDSMDALMGGKERNKFNERRKAARKGKLAEVKGDYGDGKAKKNSGDLRGVLAKVRDTRSILVIICQTRDAIDAGPFEPQETRAGGRALTFYSHTEMWMSKGATLKKAVRGVDRQIGMMSNIHIKKNRLSGKEWRVKVPFYHTVGVDDVGCCVDYLIAEKHWPANDKGVITAPELSFKGTREKLIQVIEEGDKEVFLRKTVAAVWRQVEADCAVKRKPRYG